MIKFDMNDYEMLKAAEPGLYNYWMSLPVMNYDSMYEVGNLTMEGLIRERIWKRYGWNLIHVGDYFALCRYNGGQMVYFCTAATTSSVRPFDAFSNPVTALVMLIETEDLV